MTDDQIEELAKVHRVALGMRPPARMVPISETHMGFRHPPGFTPYGEKLLAYTRAVIAIERERCLKIVDKWANAKDNPADIIELAIREGEEP